MTAEPHKRGLITIFLFPSRMTRNEPARCGWLVLAASWRANKFECLGPKALLVIVFRHVPLSAFFFLLTTVKASNVETRAFRALNKQIKGCFGSEKQCAARGGGKSFLAVVGRHFISISRAHRQFAL